MSTLEGMTMHPLCRHIKEKQNTSLNSISLFFLNQIVMFPCCSTREDLSIDVSITNVGLILTKLW